MKLKTRFSVLSFSLFSCLCGMVYGQEHMDDFKRMQSPPSLYQVVRTEEVMCIDGKEGEATWKNLPWSEPFVDIEGAARPQPRYATAVKMAYDQQHLYILARMQEPHVWGDITTHDEIIFHNNDFEVFLQPDVHQDYYYELEINPLNTVFDLALSRPYRFGGKALIHWDIKGLQTAVHVDGTLNDARDEDQCWTVEIAIPFAGVHSFGTPATPVANSFWRLNFSRVQWQHTLDGGRYTRLKVDGKIVSEDNWVWSPIGLVNMHHPERWGYLQFVDSPTPARLPRWHYLKQLGWNIHYLQQIYHRQNNRYAPDNASLPGFAEHIAPLIGNYLIRYTHSGDFSFYALDVQDPSNGSAFRIDSEGNTHYHE